MIRRVAGAAEPENLVGLAVVLVMCVYLLGGAGEARFGDQVAPPNGVADGGLGTFPIWIFTEVVSLVPVDGLAVFRPPFSPVIIDSIAVFPVTLSLVGVDGFMVFAATFSFVGAEGVAVSGSPFSHVGVAGFAVLAPVFQYAGDLGFAVLSIICTFASIVACLANIPEPRWPRSSPMEIFGCERERLAAIPAFSGKLFFGHGDFTSVASRPRRSLSGPHHYCSMSRRTQVSLRS